MTDCSWCLLLDGFKAYNIRQLREHFDTAALVGYYQGGSLGRWLAEVGEYEILKRVDAIGGDEDIGITLQHIFGVNPDISYTPVPPEERRAAKAALLMNASPVSSFSAAAGLPGNSFSGSFGNSFSFGLIESSFAGLMTSFGKGYGAGYGAGSFSTTSFMLTSFSLSGRGRAGGSYGSGGSFGISGEFHRAGSFYYTSTGAEITEQEYRRTMINLSSCPLNEYGYGIHLV